MLAQGRWFSLGTPASSTTKTGRHDRAEILLKVALSTKNSNSNSFKHIFVILDHATRVSKRIHDNVVSFLRDNWFVLWLLVVLEIKALTWPHHFTKSGGLAPQSKFDPVTFYCSACTKPVKWVVMYLGVTGIDFASFYDFSIVFWNCSDIVVFYFVFLILLWPLILRRSIFRSIWVHPRF